MDVPSVPLLASNASSSVTISSTVAGVVGGSVVGNSSVPLAKDFIPQFLLPQNLNHAPCIPKGPIRKHSDFEQVVYKTINSSISNKGCAIGVGGGGAGGELPLHLEKPNDYSKGGSNGNSSSSSTSIGRLRTREEIVLHFIMELNMLRKDWVIIFAGFVMQWVHSILTNLAYYYHTQLSAAQRIPLKDIAYETLPVLEGGWWMVSEYLFVAMLFTIIISIASILVMNWNPPHGRPLYCIPIIKRLFMTLSCCQVLRCVSFLVTTLPGASRQCLYNVPEDMGRDELIFGPAHDRGNPNGWAPPITMNDIIWRMDATNGCGDLMFSSHTIFTMLFVCIIWRYFNWGFLKYSMLTMQVSKNYCVPYFSTANMHIFLRKVVHFLTSSTYPPPNFTAAHGPFYLGCS